MARAPTSRPSIPHRSRIDPASMSESMPHLPKGLCCICLCIKKQTPKEHQITYFWDHYQNTGTWEHQLKEQPKRSIDPVTAGRFDFFCRFFATLRCTSSEAAPPRRPAPGARAGSRPASAQSPPWHRVTSVEKNTSKRVCDASKRSKMVDTCPCVWSGVDTRMKVASWSRGSPLFQQHGLDAP